MAATRPDQMELPSADASRGASPSSTGTCRDYNAVRTAPGINSRVAADIRDLEKKP
jgi:hypothetical protein